MNNFEKLPWPMWLGERCGLKAELALCGLCNWAGWCRRWSCWLDNPGWCRSLGDNGSAFTRTPKRKCCLISSLKAEPLSLRNLHHPGLSNVHQLHLLHHPAQLQRPHSANWAGWCRRWSCWTLDNPGWCRSLGDNGSACTRTPKRIIWFYMPTNFLTLQLFDFLAGVGHAQCF